MAERDSIVWIRIDPGRVGNTVGGMKTPEDSPTASHRFARLEGAEDCDFFEIEVSGNTAAVFRPVRKGVRAKLFYVKKGNGLFRCTGYSTRREAEQSARALFRAFLDKRFDALNSVKLRGPAPVATIGELIAAHEKNVARENKTLQGHSAAGYRNALRRVVAWGKLGGLEDGWQERAETLKGAVLDEDLVRDYLDAVVPAKESNAKLHDQRLRGALRTLALARQMFAERTRNCFKGLALPPKLKEFLKRPSEKPPRRQHQPLGDEAVRAMAQAALKLQPALYAVHLLFRHLGMRNDEIAHARGEWIERLAVPVAVHLFDGTRREVAAFMVIENREYWAVKKSGGKVPIAAEVLAELDAAVGVTTGREYLIPALTVTDRWELVNVAHNDFVRPWTEHLQKRSYELRRWAGTKVRMMHRSREMGDIFLRHAPTSVGELNYFTDAPVPAPIMLSDCGL